jgi:hypothetical protein
MRQLRESLEIYLHSFMVAMAALAWASELYLIEKRFSPNRGLPFTALAISAASSGESRRSKLRRDDNRPMRCD